MDTRTDQPTAPEPDAAAGPALKSVVFQLAEPQTLPVGHTCWHVTAVEFSVSRRGWLRALASRRDPDQKLHWDWATVGAPGTNPDWYEHLIAQAMLLLPHARPLR